MDKTAEHCRKFLNLYHKNQFNQDQYLFYTVSKGEKHQMSDDNVARFLKVYCASAKKKSPEIPDKINPHLFRHTRAMHLYRGGMPLALLAEWLGHSQLETTLIYANADTEMKRQAIQKATTKCNPINDERESYNSSETDSSIIRQLFGLI